MAEETSTPETGEAFDTDAFADSLLRPEPKEAPKPEKAKEAAPDAEAEATEDEAEEVEDTGEDPEDDAEDDDTTEEDVEDEGDEPLYTVKVDGQDRQVTLAELQKNYSLESASQKRMREAAELRSQLDSQIKQTAAEQQQMREAFKRRMAELAQPSEQEPDWVKMAEDDPLGYVSERAKWDAAARQRQQAQQQFQAMQAQEYQQRLHQGREALFEAIPEWKDAEKYAADTREIGTTAMRSYGFTEQEVGGILDPRMVHVLRDAVKYRKLQSGKPETAKKVAKASRVMKPGASVTKAEQRAEASRSVADRVRKTGSMDDFTAWMLGGKS